MKNYLLKPFLLVIVIISLFNCSTVKEHSMNIKHLEQHPLENKQSLYYADFDATRRGAIIVHDKTSNKNAIKILAEPSPDASLALIKNLSSSLSYADKVNASVSGYISETLNKLTNRTTSVNILRDAMYRLSEYAYNNELKEDAYLKSFNQILTVASDIARLETRQVEAQIKEAEAEKAKAEGKANKYQTALELENEGYNLLLEGKIKEAKEKFAELDSFYPTFHSAFELKNLLMKHEKEKTVLKEIVKKIMSDGRYNYSMRVDVRDAFKKILEEK